MAAGRPLPGPEPYVYVDVTFEPLPASVASGATNVSNPASPRVRRRAREHEMSTRDRLVLMGVMVVAVSAWRG